jgi:hypothetical protein
MSGSACGVTALNLVVATDRRCLTSFRARAAPAPAPHPRRNPCRHLRNACCSTMSNFRPPRTHRLTHERHAPYLDKPQICAKVPTQSLNFDPPPTSARMYSTRSYSHARSGNRMCSRRT